MTVVTPIMADSVVDSIGVNTAWGPGITLGQVNNPYADYNFPDLSAKLYEVGIRHIRAALWPSTTLYNRMAELAANGVKANWIMGQPNNRDSAGTLTQLIAAIKGNLLNVTESVE